MFFYCELAKQVISEKLPMFVIFGKRSAIGSVVVLYNLKILFLEKVQMRMLIYMHAYTPMNIGTHTLSI